MMCGRFALVASAKAIEKQFALKKLPPFTPRYNIAPTQLALVIRQTYDLAYEAAWLHWGLIPFWAKEKKMRNQFVNARAETAAIKPAFRHAYKKQRCILVMSGFFEWCQRGKIKQPYYIQAQDKRLLVVAALWESWQDPINKEQIESCCLLTVEACDQLQALHPRMPVLLNEEERAIWGDNSHACQAAISATLRPKPALQLDYYPVTTAMNHPSFDHEQAIQRLI